MSSTEPARRRAGLHDLRRRLAALEQNRPLPRIPPRIVTALGEYDTLPPEDRAVRYVTADNWASLCRGLAARCRATHPQSAASFDVWAERPTPLAITLMNKLAAVALVRQRQAGAGA
jgi:hypothetical protein